MKKSVQFFGKFVSAIVILGITAFFTPGFVYGNWWILLVCILSLTLLDFFFSSFTGLLHHPLAKGIFGFILALIAIYVMQLIVVGYTLSWLAILFGALVYGVVDYMLPSNLETKRE
jgi:hypothetical protein